MTTKLYCGTPRLLLAAGLLLGVAAAQAAGGYIVDKDQEALITIGMDKAEVLQALGRPEADAQFRNEPGPTLTYRVSGARQTHFDVDFGADGKVVSTSERIDESGIGRGGRGGRR
jgi:SmpA / OmlA family